MANREENAYMANEAIVEWLETREVVNDIFTGVRGKRITKRKKPRSIYPVESHHRWSKGTQDRDNAFNQKLQIRKTMLIQVQLSLRDHKNQLMSETLINFKKSLDSCVKMLQNIRQLCEMSSSKLALYVLPQLLWSLACVMT